MNDEMFKNITFDTSLKKSILLEQPVEIVVPKKDTTVFKHIGNAFGLLFVAICFAWLYFRLKKKDAYIGRTLPGIEKPKVETVSKAPQWPVRPPMEPMEPFEPMAPVPLATEKKMDIVTIKGPFPLWAKQTSNEPESKVSDTDADIEDLVRAREAFTKNMEAEMKIQMEAEKKKT